ncbi:MAG TPA: hypothetical protein VN213_12385 [Solirubrobacteraceae bacterium]|nr:hypothetical protein [Solirubrobacteraceae bacterium]
MSAAGLRRAGFAATVAVALLMLASALHGMTRVDTTLEIASAAPPERQILVVDERERWTGRGGAHDCREPRPRI